MAKRTKSLGSRPIKSEARPMRPLTSLPDVIISQIIFLADQKAVCVGPALDHEMNEQTPRRPSADLLALASTCKTIRTIAKRLVWHNVWIPLTSEGLELATYLDQADDETRRLVRTISLGPSGPQDRTDYPPDAHDEILCRLLPRLPSLRALHSALTTSKVLNVVESIKLDTLSLMVLTRPVSPLVPLRRLDLVYGVSLSDDDVRKVHDSIVASASTLEHLDVGLLSREGQAALQDVFFPSSSDTPLSLPRLHTLYIRAPSLDPSFFTRLAIAAPKIHTLNVPMDDIEDPVKLDVPPGSFPNLARLEFGLPPQADGSSTGVEMLVKGNKHLRLLTLHLSASDSLAVVEAASESVGLTQLLVSKSSTALLRQIGLSLPNVVNLDFEDIHPATSNTGGEREFEYSDLPTLLAPLTHLRSLVISAQRIISPIRSFERLLADPGKPRSESEINDIFDALDERDMPSMLPTVLKMFKDHADCEVLRWLSYGLSRDWRRRGKKIESDVAFPVPDEEREKERGLKDRHRVQVQTETQWRKRVGAMEQRWIERSLKQESDSDDGALGGGHAFYFSIFDGDQT